MNDKLDELFLKEIEKFKEKTKELDYLREGIRENLELNGEDKEKNELLLMYAFKKMMKK